MSNDLSISVASLGSQSVSEVNSFGLKADFGVQKPVPSSVLNATGKALLVLDHAKHNRTGAEEHTGTFLFSGRTTHNGGISTTNLSSTGDINTATQFVGPGTGLTGTGANFTAGDANNLGGHLPSYYMPASYKGSANGVAELDSNGKVPVSQIPSSIVGAMKYQGTWNAGTNLTSTGIALYGATQANLGHYFLVSAPGTQTIAGQTITVNTGDWVVSDGSAGWVVIDNTEQVSSVNGKGGAVVLNLDDINNVNAPSPANQSVLYYNGTSWTSLLATSLPFAQNLDGLTDVAIGSPQNGQIITYNGSQWVNTNFPSLNYIPTSEKNAANGVATLDASSRVKAPQGLLLSDSTGTYQISMSGGVLVQTKIS